MNSLNLFDYDALEKQFFDAFQGLTSHVKPFLPYNWVKKDNQLILEIAVAGYPKDMLEVEALDGAIKVVGKALDNIETEFLFKGITSKGFNSVFPFNPFYRVKEAILEDGLLKIFFEREKDSTAKVEIKTAA